VVAALLNALHAMDTEQLRVDRPLVEAEVKVFYALFGLTSFHDALWSQVTYRQRTSLNALLYRPQKPIPRINPRRNTFFPTSRAEP
jgi:hypothetical protein